jgi:fatty-acyl-CoA synthase
MPNALLSALSTANVYVRAIAHTGMYVRLTPRALPTLIRSRRAGSSGPSTLVKLNAVAQPTKQALVWKGHRLTYAELDRRVDRLAHGLSTRHGIGKGDAAVILMHNRGEIVEVQAAMSRLGGGAVSVSWRSTPSELEYLVNHCGAKAVFAEASTADNLLAARERLPGVPERNFVAVGGRRAGLVPYDEVMSGADAVVKESDEAGAVIIYTSGTTGKPKGAVRRFPKEQQEAVLRFVLETPIRIEDRHLAVCPMYHSTAFGFIAITMAIGGTVVVAPKFDPEQVLATIERERITTTAMVPTMLHRLVELPEAVVAKYDTRSLRVVFSGGSSLSGALARRFMERFGHVLYNFYGATETGINTLATPDELLRSPGTIGHVVPGNEIRLLDDDGREVARGETGELYVRNAMLVSGYHRDDDATRASMRDGLFSVGDLAHQDAEGLFHIDGRKRDMIISGGVNVYPAEVEEVLMSHPAVGEAAVIGIPDDEWGERVRAFVALRDGASASAEEIVAWAKREMAGPKVPREVVVLPELPKNPTGKVLKRELREL